MSLSNIFLLTAILLASSGLTGLYRKWALKRLILDIPSERSSHEVPTPRGGGIAFVLIFYAGLTFLFFRKQIDRDLFLALAPGLVIAVTGLIEDVKHIRSSIRLLIQFLCAAAALFFLKGVGSFFGVSLFWLWSLLALVGIVWFTNLYNFMDGIDGFAAMETISISFALWFFTDVNVFILLAFTTGGFLYWNWPKARIFMGDSGSTTLGFIIAVIGIYLNNKNILGIQFWIIITSLFWFDATVTLLRRKFNNEELSMPHRNHMYQRAVLGGFSHMMTTIYGCALNLVLVTIAWLLWREHISLPVGLISAILINAVVFWYIESRYPFVVSKGS